MVKMINFKVIKKSVKSQARLGLLETAHGVVETPAFVPVATQAVVKTLTSEEAVAAGSQLTIGNTFHLHLQPGEKIVAQHGGLHKFMHWSKPLMTDSGGFQVFSLGFGRDHGVGKIIHSHGHHASNLHGDHAKVELGQQPAKVRITDRGVFFNSPVDGKRLFIGPKESIQIQEKLGADIIFAFDECTSPLADYEYTKKSLATTHRWARECLQCKTSRQALFGIVQGGKFKDLRVTSARTIGSLPFDGFGIGGEFGADKTTMAAMINWVIKTLPADKPRHLLGIGQPDDIAAIVKAGVDLFDCSAPTHYARRGVAFTSAGRMDLTRSRFLKDQAPLDKKCGCYVCGDYSRGYLCHLLRAKEITPLKLLTFHNLFYCHHYLSVIREKIKSGKM